MLILSRRPHEQIVFPTLNIKIDILRIQGSTVRLGVDAPRTIPVLRGELEAGNDLVPPPTSSSTKPSRHELRGRLNTATIALYLAQRQFQTGHSRDAEATLQSAIEHLVHLDEELSRAMPTEKKQPPRRRLRTLVVEDNAYEQALLKSYLRLSGVEVVSANDGGDALEYLSRENQDRKPDAILLDMAMPRVDGPTTVSAIRNNPAYANLRIYAVSGSSPEEFDLPRGPGGIDGWFRKPLNPEEIVDALSKISLGN